MKLNYYILEIFKRIFDKTIFNKFDDMFNQFIEQYTEPIRNKDKYIAVSGIYFQRFK